MAEEPWAQPAITRRMPMILSAAGALGVAPFAVMRWLAGDWPVAIIDFAIVSGFVTLGTYIYRTRKVRVASVLISILCEIGRASCRERAECWAVGACAG